MKRADLDSPPDLPFSRPYLADSVRDGGDYIKISANEAERAALARELGLVAIASLSAEFSVTRHGRYGARARGEIKGAVTQTCVVSLEPFDAAIKATADVRYAPEAERAAAQAKAAALLKAAIEAGGAITEGEEPPDPIIDGKIDLGALAAEYLALGLDPYPRKPGAVFAPQAEDLRDTRESDAKVSPFAVLQNITKKPK